jgi:hypothetical protein
MQIEILNFSEVRAVNLWKKGRAIMILLLRQCLMLMKKSVQLIPILILDHHAYQNWQGKQSHLPSRQLQLCITFQSYF